jgi:hypothetical protein
MTHQEFITQIAQRLVKVYNPLEIYLFGKDAWEVDEDPDDIDVKIIVQSSAETNQADRAESGYKALADLGCEEMFIEVFTKDEFATMTKEQALTFVLTQKYGTKIY